MDIISLSPTQTEILTALGIIPAGVTSDCDFPRSVLPLPKFGSWHAPELHRIIEANPDLVCTFGSHQEEIKNTLIDAGLSVYHSDPGSVDASLESIRELADILDCRTSGRILLEELSFRLQEVRQKLAGLKPEDCPRVLRIMHWEPLITVGPGSFQHNAIGLAGGFNVMADGPSRYFVCDPGVVQSRNPDLIFFCEPSICAYLKKQNSWNKVSAVRYSRVHVFDCGLTCRSGPRIVDMVEQLAKALHPGLFGELPANFWPSPKT